MHYDNVKKILSISYSYNEELKNIPIDTEKIIFVKCVKGWFYGGDSLFNQKIKKHTLPYSLKELIFGSFFNQEIDEKVLPNRLTHLTFGDAFNQEIKEKVLPKKLTHLTFKCYFNQEIKEKVLPSQLIHLTFGYNFNQEIKEKVLPSQLIHLTFGYNFNQEIKEKVLPSQLTHLTFGYYFNKKIFFPESLIELRFNSKSQIKNNISHSIEKVFIDFSPYDVFFTKKNYDNTITNIPSTVKEIIINDEYKKHLITKIPFGCVIKNSNGKIL
jgi:hypothetical protein